LAAFFSSSSLHESLPYWLSWPEYVRPRLCRARQKISSVAGSAQALKQADLMQPSLGRPRPIVCQE